MLKIAWRQSPVTVLRFLSKSVIIIGCANEIRLFDLTRNCVVGSWNFHEYVTVHHVTTAEDSNTGRFLVAVAGNRFYAGAYLSCRSKSTWNFSVLFECYRSDNIVGCRIVAHQSLSWFCFTSAHGRTIITCLPIITNNETFCEPRAIANHALNGSAACYCGVVECRALSAGLSTISFFGATFGQILIRVNEFHLTPDGQIVHSSHSELDTLHCQKGVIFSLSLCAVNKARDRFHLVSAAEDRSIAVWTKVLGTDSDITKCRNSWELLYRLDGGSMTKDVLFESRIRMVVASKHGALAVGEVSVCVLSLIIIIIISFLLPFLFTEHTNVQQTFRKGGCGHTKAAWEDGRRWSGSNPGLRSQFGELTTWPLPSW
ncbi:unnamed protein product [Echinostoma caproni]|uniref:WD_REPEATS_REGION domain-containing protein n=1 Tax=Echinostoma caproni TaxID=27848 RepID=A0A183BB62_9TREM|nr:unnamed protein product [Echinostoma caproni]